MNGTLLIAGGNIGATEQGKREIFGRFASLCGGKDGKAMLVVCASGDCAESWSINAEKLREAGIGDVVLLPLTEDCELISAGNWTNQADEKLLPLFDGVRGIWFAGGDQLRTVRLLCQKDNSDTPVLRRIRQVLEDGGVIGGTSAGAAIMSRTMIVRGDDAGALTLPICTDVNAYPDLDAEAAPEQLLLLNGLGFLPFGVVDQHFNRRARLQRLIAAMEAADERLGFGISEDTALEVDLARGEMRVHGSAYVMRLTRQNDHIIIEKKTAAASAVQYNKEEKP